MIKNIARFEHKVGERIYTFLCDTDSPLGEAHDALCSFKSHVFGLISAAHEKDKAAAEEKDKKEE